MSKDLSKYLHRNMDKEAGLEHTIKRTKIVATVGPSCDTYEKLLDLVKAGVNVFRLNFSHGTHEGKQRSLNSSGRSIQKSHTILLYWPICRDRNYGWAK
jgi:pyruvate kinase